MAEIIKQSDEQLEEVAGGYAYDEGWRTVVGLQTGYLALRYAPVYDPNNELRGCESYNGQKLRITGGYVQGADGRTYVWVFNPRANMSGYVNAAYLG